MWCKLSSMSCRPMEVMAEECATTAAMPNHNHSRGDLGPARKEEKASDDQHAAARKGSGRSMARPSANSPGADLKLMSAWPGVRSGSLVRWNPPPGIAPGARVRMNICLCSTAVLWRFGVVEDVDSGVQVKFLRL